MGKTITINQNSLLAIKESMVGINDVSHNNVCVNEAAPEVDEFELGQESDNPPVGGNYAHVEENKMTSKNKSSINEGYLRNRLSSIDLSEVGRVNYSFDFDEDEYNEWLAENGLQDSEETRYEFYKDQWEYGVEYFDNETYHFMDGDSGLSYDDLEDLFGENMAETIVRTCMKDGSGYFETDDLYADEQVDINNPQELNAFAMKLLRHGEYFKGCRGFILSNGVVIYTEAEHNEVLRIPGINSKFQFIELGNIRLLPNSIDIGAEPTWEQEQVLRQVIASYDGEELYLDIFTNGGDIGVKYPRADYHYVLGEIDRFYSEGIRPQGGGFYENKDGKKIVDENVDLEVDASEIDLSSFKKRSELAPIWEDGDTLDSRVRLRLLDIADDFWEFVNLTWVKPSGIILTGSICNFNWSKYSDIDLHLIVDFDEIDEKTEFVQDYLDSKKNEWNNEHNGLTILGFPVELYVQNLGDMPKSGGVYDLEENAWIKKPNASDIKPIGLDKFSIKDKAAEIMTIIDDMYNALGSEDDMHRIEEIGEDAHYLWKKVKDMRQTSLEKNGESGAGNIVYKILRRMDYLDKLWKLSTLTYDKTNSIEEGKKIYISENKLALLSKSNIPQLDESVKKYLTLLKEETVADGSSEGNPYKKRWKAEREALKNFVANYGKLMQSKEDDKGGKLYKVFYDKTMSELIGYNYCICVQWDEVELKPKSTVYIRALDKFTPFIRRNLQYDDRGFDNQRGTYDDMGYSRRMESKKIYVDESKLSLLTESKNSKWASKKTRELMAQMESESLGRTVSLDDPEIVEAEKEFEQKWFGEGKRQDWFVVLEPNIYYWITHHDNENDVKGYVDYIYQHATSVTKERTITMEYLQSHGVEKKSELAPEQQQELATLIKPERQKLLDFINQVRPIWDFNELKSFLDKQIEADKAAAKEAQANMEVNLNPNYQVLGPLSYDESREYGQYSGLDAGAGGGQICYTTSSGQRYIYSKGETNSLYLLLRKDWKEVSTDHDGSEVNNGLPEPLNKYNGYDDYGLSMIFVWVNPIGELKYSNTRWNHRARYAPGHGVDTAMTETDIATLMGAPFAKIFGFESFDEKLMNLEKRLANGEAPEDLFIISGMFGEYKIVRIEKGDDYVENLLDNNNKLVYDHWLTAIMPIYYEFSDYKDSAVIILEKDGQERHNVINTKLELLCDEPFEKWPKYVGVLQGKEPYRITLKNWRGYYESYNENWEMLGNKMFENLPSFYGKEYAWVIYENMGKSCRNYIDRNGNFLFDDIITSNIQPIGCNSMTDANIICLTRENDIESGEYLFFNTLSMKPIGDRWYDRYICIHSYKIALVKSGSKYNFLNLYENEYVFDEWCDDVARIGDRRDDGWLAYFANTNKVYQVWLNCWANECEWGEFTQHIIQNKPYGV